jgi:hypothetical protein
MLESRSQHFQRYSGTQIETSVNSKQYATKKDAKQEENDKCKETGIHELKHNQCNDVHVE